MQFLLFAACDSPHEFLMDLCLYRVDTSGPAEMDSMAGRLHLYPCLDTICSAK